MKVIIPLVNNQRENLEVSLYEKHEALMGKTRIELCLRIGKREIIVNKEELLQAIKNF